MKRNNFLLLALTSAILSTWTVNAYAVQVCYDSADSVCEEVTLVSPKDGSQIGYDSIEVTIKFGERSDELQEKINATTTGSDPVKYNIAIEEEGASTGCKSSQKELAKQNISFPYLGNKVNCNLTLNNDKKYKIYLQVNNKRVELGSFIYKDSTPWVTSGEPTHGIIYNKKAMISPPILYSALTSENDTKCDFKLFSYDDTSSPQVEVSKYDDDPATIKWFWKEDGDKTPARLPDGRYLIYLNVSEAEENSLSVIPFFVDQTSPATKVQTPEENKGYVVLKELKGNIHADGDESKGERYAHFKYTIKQGSTEVKGEGYADEQGNFSLTLDNTLKDNGDYTLIIDARDQAGNPATTVEVPFKIEAPIITVTTLSSSTESPTKLSGTGTPGTTLTITFGPKEGTQTEITPKPVVGTDGTWSVELSTPNDGTYTYEVKGVYIFGTADTDKKTVNVTNENGEFTVTLPAPTLDASLADEATVNTDYEVKGTGTANTTVVITILDASGNVVGTAKEVTVGADGNWTTNVQFTSAATYKVKVSYKGINKSSEKEVVAKAADNTQPGDGTTQPGDGGQGGTQGGSGGSDSDSSDDGCGCATPGGSDVPSGGFLLALLGTIGWVARRRRK